MSSSQKLNNACQEILDNCSKCGQCISECPMLERIGEDLVSIATRQPTVEEAYACSLCGLCEAVCPASLSPRTMFAEARTKAVEDDEILIDEFRYMFPDRDLNVMTLYRELNGTHYEEFPLDQTSPVAFFPGCTLLTYSPELTKAAFNNLKQRYPELVLLTDCCGKPLYQLGLERRGDDYVSCLMAKLEKLKVRSLIVACPSCYYQLRPAVSELGITLMTIYEALGDSPVLKNRTESDQLKLVTVHDSCPDRFEEIFASQTRAALKKRGYQLVEMEHSRKTTACCGSGGQVTHFQPELADNMIKSRLDEIKRSGAQIMASYCLSCVLNLSRNSGYVPTKHVLNLLLDLDQDFEGLKNKAKRMFDGPEGEKLWERVMAD